MVYLVFRFFSGRLFFFGIAFYCFSGERLTWGADHSADYCVWSREGCDLPVEEMMFPQVQSGLILITTKSAYAILAFPPQSQIGDDVSAGS